VAVYALLESPPAMWTWRRVCTAAVALAMLAPVAAAGASGTPVAATASDVPAHITAKLSSSHPRSPSNWWLTPVTVTFTCTAGSTPIVKCPAPVKLTRSGRRESVTRSVLDTDGQRSAVTISRINVDIVGPKVWINGPQANRTYTSAAPEAHCGASDKLSGMTSCRLTKTSKHLSHGSRVTLVAVAIARSGARRSLRLSYVVS
jgi:hypothetical protein